MRKPRLTNRILDGIMAGLSVLEAGECDDAFGGNEPEQQRDFENVLVALRWARQMANYRDAKKEAAHADRS